MPFLAEAITLAADERAELEQMTQSRTLPAGDVFHARLILMLAEGLSYRTIQQKLSKPKRSVQAQPKIKHL